MAEQTNVGRFLEFLGAAEGASYNTIVGGGSFNGYEKHPGIVGLRTKEGPSTAAGKYQITKTTYDDVAPSLGITDFSPESQDKIAIELIRRKGALADVQSGNYEAAISKLGGTWASLPSSPYSQPKRSSEWVNAYFGGNLKPALSAPPELQNQQFTGDRIVPEYGASMTEQTLKGFQNEAKYGGVVNQIKNLPEAIGLGFETQNYTYNWLMHKNVGQYDRELTITKQFYQDATEGIPRDHHDYVMAGINREDIYARAARVRESMEKQKKLGEMGLVGGVGAFTGALLDLPTLVGFVPGLGSVSMVSKVSRLKNALATGMAMAAGNAAAEAALHKYRPLATEDDIYFAAAMGLGFGAPMGALARPGGRAVAGAALGAEVDSLAQLGIKTANKMQIDEIEQAGLKLTPTGQKILDPNPSIEKVIKQEVETVKQEAKAIPVHEKTSAYTEFIPKNSGGKPYPAQSTRDFLTRLAKEVDETVSVPAKRLLEQLGEDLPFYFVPKSAKALVGRPGVYYPEAHIAVLSRESKTTTQIHEIAHALTVHRLEFGKANPETAIGKITSEIEGLYQQALDEARKQGFDSYYLKNIREFTAGLYGGHSAKPMVEFLSKIKVEGDETLLSKFVDAMRRILGFDEKEMNLYLKSLDATDRLMDEALNVRIKSTRTGGKDREFMADDADFLPEKGADAKVGFTQYGPAIENFFARSWVPQEARDWFHKMANSTTGYKGHQVVERSAWDHATILGGGWKESSKKAWAFEFKKYFNEQMENGKATRWQQNEMFGKWEESLGDYIRGVQGQYHPTVISAGNSIRTILKDVVDHINNPAKFNGGVKRGLTQIEETDPITGIKGLSEPLPYNDNFLPRQPDVAKFHTMVSEFGPETVQKFFANMFQSANKDLDPKLAERFGRFYYNNLQDAKLNRKNDSLENMLRGFDRDGLREQFKTFGKMSDDEAEELIMALFPGKDVSANPISRNLKHRSRLDESYTEDIILPDGTKHTISINDFINTRTTEVLDAYYARTAGSIALANSHDIYKMSDLEKSIMKATEQEFGAQALSPDRLQKLRETMEFVSDRILARPVEQFSVGNKFLEMWRNFNINRLMGFAVANQVQEISQVTGSMGFKAVAKAIPELGSLVRNPVNGKVANEMLDKLENITGGAGADILSRLDFNPRDDWVRNRGNTALNRWLDRADNVLNSGSTNLLKYTGMTGVMVQTKRIHAIAMINHMLEAARGETKLVFSAERLAVMGLDEADTAKVLAKMKEYNIPKKDSKIGTLDIDKWQMEDPESFSKFIVAFHRESRRVVQENDLASMVPIMGKGWGQTMFQFMNFSLQGWNKSMMYAMNHKDYQTLSTVLHGSMFAAATYIARTKAQTVGMSAEEKDDFLEKRLSTKQIIANSFGRLAQVSVMPMLIDSTIAPTPWFSGAKTTSNVTDLVGANPTLSAISTAISIPRKAIAAGLSDETQISEKDMRSWMRLLPYNNVVGISNVLNAVAAEYPNTTKQDD